MNTIETSTSIKNTIIDKDNDEIFSINNLLLASKLLSNNSKKNDKSSLLPLDLQIQLAMLWRTLKIIKNSEEMPMMLQSFFEDFLNEIKALPRLSLSTFWEDKEEKKKIDENIEKIKSYVGINSDSSPIALLSLFELSYLQDIDSEVDVNTDMINDPLGIVDKILEFAENFSMTLPSCDRGTVLSLCLALGVKSGRLSILLQTILSLVVDEEMSVDIDIDLIKDITNSLKIKEEIEIKNITQIISSSSSSSSNQTIKDNLVNNFSNKKIGLVLSFGKADQGKLGHGDTQLNRLVPSLIESLQSIDIVKVASMSTNALAIDSNGGVYVWGAGSGGSPNTLHSLRSEICPVIMECLPPKSVVVDISCGLAHSLFLLKTGRVLSRGNGSNGRLGLGDCSDRVEASFVSIISTDFITSVQCGACHSLALNSKGELYCWGKNTQGQCGIGNIEDVLIPTINKTFQIIPLFIVEIAAGWEHSACITKEGNLYTWGCGYKDSRRGVIPPVLGQGNNEGKLSPELVSSIDGVKVSKITCGWDHCLALDMKGKVLSWGSGQNGKLGHGNEENISIPCYIPSLERLNIVSISAGSEHSAAISDTGIVYTWGHGDGGRLGHGDNLQYLLPSPVISLGAFNACPADIHCGDKFTIVIVQPKLFENQIEKENFILNMNLVNKSRIDSEEWFHKKIDKLLSISNQDINEQDNKEKNNGKNSNSTKYNNSDVNRLQSNQIINLENKENKLSRKQIGYILLSYLSRSKPPAISSINSIPAHSSQYSVECVSETFRYIYLLLHMHTQSFFDGLNSLQTMEVSIEFHSNLIDDSTDQSSHNNSLSSSKMKLNKIINKELEETSSNFIEDELCKSLSLSHLFSTPIKSSLESTLSHTETRINKSSDKSQSNLVFLGPIDCILDLLEDNLKTLIDRYNAYNSIDTVESIESTKIIQTEVNGLNLSVSVSENTDNGQNNTIENRSSFFDRSAKEYDSNGEQSSDSDGAETDELEDEDEEDDDEEEEEEDAEDLILDSSQDGILKADIETNNKPLSPHPNYFDDDAEKYREFVEIEDDLQRQSRQGRENNDGENRDNSVFEFRGVDFQGIRGGSSNGRPGSGSRPGSVPGSRQSNSRGLAVQVIGIGANNSFRTSPITSPTNIPSPTDLLEYSNDNKDINNSLDDSQNQSLGQFTYESDEDTDNCDELNNLKNNSVRVGGANSNVATPDRHMVGSNAQSPHIYFSPYKEPDSPVHLDIHTITDSNDANTKALLDQKGKSSNFDHQRDENETDDEENMEDSPVFSFDNHSSNEGDYELGSDGMYHYDGDDNMDVQRAILSSMLEDKSSLNIIDKPPVVMQKIKDLLISLSINCYNVLEKINDELILIPNIILKDSISSSYFAASTLWLKIQKIINSGFIALYSLTTHQSLLHQLISSPETVQHIMPGLCDGLNNSTCDFDILTISDETNNNENLTNNSTNDNQNSSLNYSSDRCNFIITIEDILNSLLFIKTEYLVESNNSSSFFKKFINYRSIISFSYYKLIFSIVSNIMQKLVTGGLEFVNNSNHKNHFYEYWEIHVGDILCGITDCVSMDMNRLISLTSFNMDWKHSFTFTFLPLLTKIFNFSKIDNIRSITIYLPHIFRLLSLLETYNFSSIRSTSNTDNLEEIKLMLDKFYDEMKPVIASFSAAIKILSKPKISLFTSKLNDSSVANVQSPPSLRNGLLNCLNILNFDKYIEDQKIIQRNSTLFSASELKGLKWITVANNIFSSQSNLMDAINIKLKPSKILFSNESGDLTNKISSNFITIDLACLQIVNNILNPLRDVKYWKNLNISKSLSNSTDESKKDILISLLNVPKSHTSATIGSSIPKSEVEWIQRIRILLFSIIVRSSSQENNITRIITLIEKNNLKTSPVSFPTNLFDNNGIVNGNTLDVNSFISSWITSFILTSMILESVLIMFEINHENMNKRCDMYNSVVIKCLELLKYPISIIPSVIDNNLLIEYFMKDSKVNQSGNENKITKILEDQIGSLMNILKINIKNCISKDNMNSNEYSDLLLSNSIQVKSSNKNNRFNNNTNSMVNLCILLVSDLSIPRLANATIWEETQHFCCSLSINMIAQNMKFCNSNLYLQKYFIDSLIKTNKRKNSFDVVKDMNKVYNEITLPSSISESSPYIQSASSISIIPIIQSIKLLDDILSSQIEDLKTSSSIETLDYIPEIITCLHIGLSCFLYQSLKSRYIIQHFHPAGLRTPLVALYNTIETLSPMKSNSPIYKSNYKKIKEVSKDESIVQLSLPSTCVINALSLCLHFDTRFFINTTEKISTTSPLLLSPTPQNTLTSLCQLMSIISKKLIPAIMCFQSFLSKCNKDGVNFLLPSIKYIALSSPTIITNVFTPHGDFTLGFWIYIPNTKNKKTVNENYKVHLLSRIEETSDINFVSLVSGKSSSCNTHPTVLISYEGDNVYLEVNITIMENNSLDLKSNSEKRSPKICHKIQLRSSQLNFDKWLNFALDLSQVCEEKVIEIKPYSIEEKNTKYKVNRIDKTLISLYINGKLEAKTESIGGRSQLHQNIILGTIPWELGAKNEENNQLMLSDVYWLQKSSISPSTTTSTAEKLDKSINSNLKENDMKCSSTLNGFNLIEPPTKILERIEQLLDISFNILEATSTCITSISKSDSSTTISTIILANITNICDFAFNMICASDEKGQDMAFKILCSVLSLIPIIDNSMYNESESEFSDSDTLKQNSFQSPHRSNGDNLKKKTSPAVGSAINVAHINKSIKGIKNTVIKMIELVSVLITPSKSLLNMNLHDFREFLDLSSDISINSTLDKNIVLNSNLGAWPLWVRRILFVREGIEKGIHAPQWNSYLAINENIFITGIASVISDALCKGIIDNSFLSPNYIKSFHNETVNPISLSLIEENRNDLSKIPLPKILENIDSNLKKDTIILISLVCGGGWLPTVGVNRLVDITPRTLFLYSDPKRLEQVVFPTSATIKKVSYSRPGLILHNCIGSFTKHINTNSNTEYILPKSTQTIIPSTEMINSRDFFKIVPVDKIFDCLNSINIPSSDDLIQLLRKIVIATSTNSDIKINLSLASPKRKKSSKLSGSQNISSKKSLIKPIDNLFSNKNSGNLNEEFNTKNPSEESIYPVNLNESKDLLQVMTHLRCLLVQLTRVSYVHGEERVKHLNQIKEIISKDLPNLLSLAGTNPTDAVSVAFDTGSFKGAQLDILKNLLKEGDVCFLEKISLRVWKQIRHRIHNSDESSSISYSDKIKQQWWKNVDGMCIRGKSYSSNDAANIGGLQLIALEGDVQLMDTKLKALSHFPSVRLQGISLEPMSGRWYYECTLLSDGLMQIGWANSQFRCDPICGQGVGDHIQSWAFDGLRMKKWNVSCEPYGRRWKLGDVVGALMDMDLLEMKFFINGEDLGPAFSNFSQAYEIFPALSLNVRQSIRVNFGQYKFIYPPDEIDGKIFRPVCEASIINKKSNKTSNQKIKEKNSVISTDKLKNNNSNNDLLTKEEQKNNELFSLNSKEEKRQDINAHDIINNEEDDFDNDHNTDDENEEDDEEDDDEANEYNDPNNEEATRLLMSMESNWRQALESSRDDTQNSNDASNVNELRRQALIENLIGMGFPVDWSLRAAEHCDASVSESTAIAWIIERMEFEQTKMEEFEGDSSRVVDEEEYEDGDEAGLEYLMQRHNAASGSNFNSRSNDDGNQLNMINSTAIKTGNHVLDSILRGDKNNLNGAAPSDGSTNGGDSSFPKSNEFSLSQEGYLGNTSWNSDVSYSPILVGRYTTRHRHDLDKQEVLAQVSELDPVDMIPIVAACELSLCIFYSRAVMIKLMTLISSENSFQESSVSINKELTPSPPSPSLPDHIENPFSFSLDLFSIFTSKLDVNKMMNFFKLCFKQCMISTSQADRLFPSLYIGNTTGEVKDKFPLFEPFTAPGCNDYFLSHLSNLELICFESSLCTIATEESEIKTLAGLSSYIDSLLNCISSKLYRQEIKLLIPVVSSNVNSTKISSSLRKDLYEMEMDLLKSVGLNLENSGKSKKKSINNESMTIPEKCVSILIYIIEECVVSFENVSTNTFDDRDWILNSLDREDTLDMNMSNNNSTHPPVLLAFYILRKILSFQFTNVNSCDNSIISLISSSALPRLLKISISTSLSLKYCIFDLSALILSRFNIFIKQGLKSDNPTSSSNQLQTASDYYVSISKEKKLLQFFGSCVRAEGIHRRIYSKYTRSVCNYLLQWQLLRRVLDLFPFNQIHDYLTGEWKIDENNFTYLSNINSFTVSTNNEQVRKKRDEKDKENINENIYLEDYIVVCQISSSSISICWNIKNMINSLKNNKISTEKLDTTNNNDCNESNYSLYITMSSNVATETPLLVLDNIEIQGTYRIVSLGSDTLYKISILMNQTNKSINENLNCIHSNNESDINRNDINDIKNSLFVYASTEGEAIFVLDSQHMSPNLVLGSNHLFLRHKANKKWSTARGNVKMTSGLHRWDIRIDRCISKNIFIGITTADARLDNYVGCDKYGWAFLANKAVWHNKSKLKGYGELFRTGDTITCVLDLDCGTLSYHLNGKDLGVAIEGLTGPIYAAFSLYNEDDQLSIIPQRQCPESITWNVSSAERLLDRMETLQCLLMYILKSEKYLTYSDSHIVSIDKINSSDIEHIDSKELKGDRCMPLNISDELYRRWKLWEQGVNIRSTLCGNDFISIVMSKNACLQISSDNFFPGDIVTFEKGKARVLGASYHRLWIQIENTGEIIGFTRDTIYQLQSKGSLRLLMRETISKKSSFLFSWKKDNQNENCLFKDSESISIALALQQQKWNLESNSLLIKWLDLLGRKYGIHPLNLDIEKIISPRVDIIREYSINVNSDNLNINNSISNIFGPLFANFTDEDIVLRSLLFIHLNDIILPLLPLISFEDGQQSQNHPSKLLYELRNIIFQMVKNEFSFKVSSVHSCNNYPSSIIPVTVPSLLAIDLVVKSNQISNDNDPSSGNTAKSTIPLDITAQSSDSPQQIISIITPGTNSKTIIDPDNTSAPAVITNNLPNDIFFSQDGNASDGNKDNHPGMFVMEVEEELVILNRIANEILLNSNENSEFENGINFDNSVDFLLASDSRWRLLIGIQASYVGQLYKFIENISGSSYKFCNDPRGENNSWELLLRKLASQTNNDKKLSKERNVPINIHANKSSLNIKNNTELFKVIDLYNKYPVNTISEWSIFSIFVSEACQQAERLINSIFIDTNNNLSPNPIIDLNSGEISLVLQFLNTTGVLIGLGLRCCIPTPLNFPTIFHTILGSCKSDKLLKLDYKNDNSNNNLKKIHHFTVSAALAFRQGIVSIYPESALSLYDSVDIKNILSGSNYCTCVNILHKYVTLDNGLKENDFHIHLFWIALRELPLLQLEVLLSNIWSNNSLLKFQLYLNCDKLPYIFRLMLPTAVALLNPDEADLMIFNDRNGISIPRYSTLPIMITRLQMLITQLMIQNNNK